MKMHKLFTFSLLLFTFFATFAVWAATETVGDITWTYQIIDNTAQVGDGMIPAIPRTTAGDIVIPSTLGDKPVTSIGEKAFHGCSGLTSVTIPSSVTSIGNYAFKGCSGLTSVTIPSGVTSIGEFAFDGCSLLFKLCIDSVESWCKISFANLSSNPFNGWSEAKTLVVSGQPTTELVIPDGVETISAYAFHNWSMITSVTIPSSVTSIGNFAFCFCSGLTRVTISEGVKSIGSCAFDGCSGLTSVVIPAGVTSTGDYAFRGCSGLTSVTIEEGVKSIGRDAFHGCSGLTSVTIPSSVESIGSWAFFNCSSLKQATVLAADPPTGGSKMFDGTAVGFVIFVPEGCGQAYRDAWSAYDTQIWEGELSRVDVKLTAGVGVEKIEFKCNGEGEFVEFPSSGTNLMVGTVIDLMVKPEWPLYYAGETQFIVPKEGTNVTINATGRMPDVNFTAGEGVEKIEFKCNGEGEFVEFPAGGTNLMVGTVIDIQVSVTEFYRYTGDTQFLLTEDCIEMEIAATEIAPGDVDRPWAAGDTVTAYTNGVGGLVIQGSGAMYDFASAAEVPWADVAKEVTAVTIEDGVTKVGGNALAGLNDTVTVNGTPISFYDMMASARGLSEPVIPDDKVLVAKEELQAAKAEAVTVADGVVYLGVSVLSNADITASSANWAPVKFTKDTQIGLSADGTKLILPIPVAAQQGFMILQSGDAKVSEGGRGPVIGEPWYKPTVED